MIAADKPSCWDLARLVHPDYPERDAVLTERLSLYPHGCFVLMQADALKGYVVAHPGRLGMPPKLDTLLVTLPEQPDTYTIHDLAIAPTARGSGAAVAIIDHIAQAAFQRGFASLSLVSVGTSRDFWLRLGFRVESSPAAFATTSSYDADARYMVRRLDR